MARKSRAAQGGRRDHVLGAANAYQRLVDAPAGGDVAAIDTLGDDVVKAKKRLQRLDDRLLDTVRQVLPPEGEEKMLEQLRKLEEDYRER